MELRIAKRKFCKSKKFFLPSCKLKSYIKWSERARGAHTTYSEEEIFRKLLVLSILATIFFVFDTVTRFIPKLLFKINNFSIISNMTTYTNYDFCSSSVSLHLPLVCHIHWLINQHSPLHSTHPSHHTSHSNSTLYRKENRKIATKTHSNWQLMLAAGGKSENLIFFLLENLSSHRYLIVQKHTTHKTWNLQKKT